MDLSRAAFGLDMRGASRIYFINPVLNPQVEAQAIGRVRRISQQKPVTVETLVLRDSIDEVILDRKKHMTQAEHRQAKSILDVGPIYEWIKNASIVSMPLGIDEIDRLQIAPLQRPQFVFGRCPDNGGLAMMSGVKREYDAGPGDGATEPADGSERSPEMQPHLFPWTERRLRSRIVRLRGG